MYIVVCMYVYMYIYIYIYIYIYKGHLQRPRRCGGQDLEDAAGFVFARRREHPLPPTR